MAERTGLPQAVGFVGLGRMGAPMVRRLAAAGVAVRGYDSAPRPELDRVVTQVEKAPLVADGVPVVVLMLPDSDVVDAVVHGAGLLDALEPGTVLVDMGSSEPLRTRALAEQVAERGAVLVDAPVSGGVSGATAGTMTIMVGGPEDVVAPLVPLFGVLGRMRHVGPVGAGHALKALNNLMSAAHLLASSEALLAGQRFGLDPAVMLEAVNGSSGRSGSTENKWPNFVLPGTFDSGFALGLMLKDIRIALGLAEATGAPSALAARTVELWAEAAEALGPAADHTEIVRWLRQERGG
ncbi:3-hydroxyisobutyrate dehydrogenase [Pseudonocardia hierapolitana]|uniref:3-hydroxyisobutyrate dehydrogenase n=1 Tax=Pseudonocardia hierapolitana TaxID=1128676 RepID=A0A561T4L7_9PSEU|nr:NAD(P)-dependent oxidoreductase [Pseudonocardia hierapolitana]TWF82061.1 3-hydroxyisobutyrate dehydrogenase [Pseudonocardia hierapolitana]